MPASDALQATPRVSVIMATYNGARFIRAAIDSIVAQTHTDFDLIVVDDASTDATAEILAGITDPRLRVIRNVTNMGVARSRNIAFAAARGDYVALLDHDDLSLPARLACQVDYLDAHPHTVLVGTRSQVLEQGALTARADVSDGSPALMAWLLQLANPLVCSSVMMRGAAARSLAVFMRAEMEFADDYDLYHRLAAYGSIARIDVPLTIYRLHEGNAFRHNEKKMSANAARVLAPSLEKLLGGDASAAAKLIVHHVAAGAPLTGPVALDLLCRAIDRITRHHISLADGAPATQRAIERHAHVVWRKVLRRTARKGCITRARLLAARPVGFKPSVRDLASIVAGDLVVRVMLTTIKAGLGGLRTVRRALSPQPATGASGGAVTSRVSS